MDKTILYNYSSSLVVFIAEVNLNHDPPALWLLREEIGTIFSRLTQLGECNLYTVEVVGSSPTVRTVEIRIHF